MLLLLKKVNTYWMKAIIKRSYKKMKKLVAVIAIAYSITIAIIAQEKFYEIFPGRVFIIDKNDNMYSDFDEHTIAKYSPAGKLLLKIGMPGEGPGDIKRLGWFAINPKDDLLYVTELAQGNKRISKFSNTGKYQGSFDIEFDYRKWDGIPFIGFDHTGNVYIIAYRFNYKRYKDFHIGSTKEELYKFSPTGKKLRKIYEFEAQDFAEKEGKGNITIPFNNSFSWAIYRDMIIIREDSAENVNIYSSDGSLKKKIRLPFKREKLKAEDLDEWEQLLLSDPGIKSGIKAGWFDFNYWKKRLPFPEYKPITGSMFIDVHGNLFIMKYSGYVGQEDTCARINIDTGKTSIIKFPGHYGNLRCIDKNYFYFLKEDEDGEFTVLKIAEDRLEYVK